MRVLIKALRIADNINEWAGNIFKFLVMALMLFVSYDVIMRYIFLRPTEWGQEVNGYLQLGVVSPPGYWLVWCPSGPAYFRRQIQAPLESR